MGIGVDNIISQTFVLSGILAGAAGVMWGIHNGLIELLHRLYTRNKSFHSCCTWRNW